MNRPMSLYTEIRSPSYEDKIIHAGHHLWRSPSASAQSLWLRCTFESRRRGRWFLERNRFPYLLVELVLAGDICYRIDGQSVNVHPGEIHLTQPGVPYRVASCGHEECYRIGLEFCGKALHPLQESLHLLSNEVIHPASISEFRLLWTAIDAGLQARTAGSEPEISARCLEMLARLADEKNNRIPGVEDPRLSAILDFIHANSEQDLNCRVLARHANCSQPTLNRLFQQNLGKTPQVYINDYRMELARDLLCIGETTIKEVADKLGFSNQFYFSRVFKKHFGFSPQTFLRPSHSDAF